MSLPHTGGIHLWNQYQRIGYAGLNRVGTMTLQTLFDAVLGSLTYDHDSGTPRSGYWGRSFEPSITGSSLDVTIAPGLAMRYDASASDDYGPAIMPIVLDSAGTVTADAADATNDRIDIISIAEDDTDDQAASRYVKDPTDGSVSAQTVYTRRALGASLTYTAGTPAASPSAPATPAGHILLCSFTVAAGATAISDLVDEREQLAMPGQLPRTIPHTAFRSESGSDIADEYHQAGAFYRLETQKGAGISHEFCASLEGMDGLRIDEMTVRASLTNAADAVVVQLRRTKKASGATSLIVQSTVSGGTGLQTDTQDVDHRIDEDGYLYILRCIITNSVAAGDAGLYCVDLT